MISKGRNMRPFFFSDGPEKGVPRGATINNARRRCYRDERRLINEAPNTTMIANTAKTSAPIPM